MSSSRRSAFPLLSILVLAGLGVGAWLLLRAGSSGPGELALHTVRKGPLKVTVLEGGSLEALKSTTIASQVEGQAAILYIVEEGTVLTPEDVAAGRVLVRLDDSDIKDKLERQQIDLQSATAARVNAATSLEIQRHQNASDVRKAELDVQFAALDLERYVGKALLAEVLKVRSAAGGPEGGPSSVPPAPPPEWYAALLERPTLDGEALQTLRRLDSEIQLADEEAKRAASKYGYSEQLAAKGYVSKEEKEADRLAMERSSVELDRARTARAQFATYDFRKELERLRSNLLEAQEMLARVRASADSALERASAELRSKQEQENLQRKRYEKYVAQLDACVVRATIPGLVLYASSTNTHGWDSDNRIAEGTTVRERQPILTIPDPESLGARINVHESVVDRVVKGQAVTVAVDAFPDRALPGVVESVNTLPNPSDRWMNPDLKVYATLIRLQGTYPNLKPGMSVKAEVLVAELKDVLSVPVQAVAGGVGRPAVWVFEGGASRETPVALGLSNDRFVEVKEGLREGDEVLLAPPRSAESGPRKVPPGGERPEGPRAPGAKPDAGAKPKEGGPAPGPAAPEQAPGGRRPSRETPGSR
jgi:multidrug resistance efflux pump